MKTALIELHYLPCIAYFSALSDCTRIVVENSEHYQKQTYRNRCYIKGPHQVETLVVPVTVGSGKGIRDVKIASDRKWLNNHWRTIRSAYGNAPFFEYYAPELEETLFRGHAFLFNLNLDLMTLCLKWLKKEVAITGSGSYVKTPDAGIVDLRDVINPKKDEGCNRFYKRIEYQQVFGSKFVPNLSLIDLVFNEGPGAWAIVKASRPSEQ